jgi:hypothetical protein
MKAKMGGKENNSFQRKDKERIDLLESIDGNISELEKRNKLLYNQIFNNCGTIDSLDKKASELDVRCTAFSRKMCRTKRRMRFRYYKSVGWFIVLISLFLIFVYLSMFCFKS